MANPTENLNQISKFESIIRNPLVIFGLIFVAGDGPLATAYIFTTDSNRAWVLLIAMIAFTFGMAIFFCYLVAFKPRHLYAPSEIPKEAYGRSIFSQQVGREDIVFTNVSPLIEKENKTFRKSKED
jgi:hypothetical protein